MTKTDAEKLDDVLYLLHTEYANYWKWMEGRDKDDVNMRFRQMATTVGRAVVALEELKK